MLGVFCPGALDVLSIGKGDIKLSIEDNDEDRAKAKKIITEMLAKGYANFVETDRCGTERVTKFDPERMVYTISDAPASSAASPKATRGPGRARKATREVTGWPVPRLRP